MAWFDGITPRAVYIKHCQQLGCRKNANLLRTLSDTPDGFSRLTELDATHNLIGRVGFKALLEVIRIAHDLHRLCLANNGLDDSSVLLLLPVIQNHPNLVYVDLSSNPLGRSCGAQLMQFVKDCPNIQWLLLEETLLLQSLLQTIERKLLENRQRGAAGGPALIEAPPSATVPAAARRRPVGPAGSGEMASGGLLLPRESTPAPVVPRRIHRYVTQPVESDPPELIRQILADEGRWKNAARCLFLEADESGIGSLTTIELGLVLQGVILKLGLMAPATQEVAMVLDLMDSDRSGRLTESEFVHAVRSYLIRRAKSADAEYHGSRGGARRMAHSDRAPWRPAQARPVVVDRPRIMERPDVAGYVADQELLEELSAELNSLDQHTMEHSGLMRWIDESKDMGGVNSYMDREALAVTLDDLDSRLGDQQYLRRVEYERQRLRDNREMRGLDNSAVADRRGRRQEGRAAEGPARRDDRYSERERGAAARDRDPRDRDRGRPLDLSRESDRLQEAYQRLQEEYRRRQEQAQGGRPESTGGQRPPLPAQGGGRAPPEDPPGRAPEPEPGLDRPPPRRPDNPSQVAQVLSGWASDALSQAEQLLDGRGAAPPAPAPAPKPAPKPAPPPPVAPAAGPPPAAAAPATGAGAGQGLRFLLGAADGPAKYIGLLSGAEARPAKPSGGSSRAELPGVSPALQLLISAGGTANNALRYLGPKG